MRLYQGDCLNIMSDMEADSVDLTVTSPPYDDLRTYNGYHFDFENIAKQLYRITKQGGVVVWVVGDRTKDGDESGTSFRQALYFKEIGFNLYDTMIYSKKGNNAVGGTGRYLQSFEYMFVFSKNKPNTINLIFDRKNKKITPKQRTSTRQIDGTLKYKVAKSNRKYGKRRNIWEYGNGNGQGTKDKIAYGHPAIFPEKLAEDHILSWSNEGDIVFDPMCGSGTTGKMAIKHNRQFIGVDISEEYIAIAKERLSTIQLCKTISE